VNDQAQRDQALDISQSFIVQAPAGSGKTELLTQRYLKLLSACDEPENIMAMTFTNKAVDEMTQRVLSALQSSFDTKPKAPHKQITYELALQVMQRSDEKEWGLLQNPKRLKISTIDGLYNLINNRYPLPLQLVPRQIMAENWARDNAYRYATEQVLLMIDDKQQGRAIADLLLHLDNNVVSFQKLACNSWLNNADGNFSSKALRQVPFLVRQNSAIVCHASKFS
jgi:ATP-dependent exoDNAse (exonuclease V) beta subunit